MKGLTKATGHHKHVHVLVEPSPKCQNIFVPGNTTELKLRGISVGCGPPKWGEVILGPHTEVGIISVANEVQPMLAPEVIKGDVQDDEKIQCKSAKVDLPESKSKPAKVDPEEILQKGDLSGTKDWDSAEQQDAHNLNHEYACIFSWNDLDLGKTIDSQAFNQIV